MIGILLWVKNMGNWCNNCIKTSCKSSDVDCTSSIDTQPGDIQSIDNESLNFIACNQLCILETGDEQRIIPPFWCRRRYGEDGGALADRMGWETSFRHTNEPIPVWNENHGNYFNTSGIINSIFSPGSNGGGWNHWARGDSPWCFSHVHSPYNIGPASSPILNGISRPKSPGSQQYYYDIANNSRLMGIEGCRVMPLKSINTSSSYNFQAESKSAEGYGDWHNCDKDTAPDWQNPQEKYFINNCSGCLNLDKEFYQNPTKSSTILSDTIQTQFSCKSG